MDTTVETGARRLGFERVEVVPAGTICVWACLHVEEQQGEHPNPNLNPNPLNPKRNPPKLGLQSGKT